VIIKLVTAVCYIIDRVAFMRRILDAKSVTVTNFSICQPDENLDKPGQ